VVAIRIRGRPWSAVLADMIEGVVAANRLSAAAADQCRTELWRLVEPPRATPERPGRVVGLRAA